MKNLIAIASATLVLFAGNASLATDITYDAKCFNPAEGDMDRCRVMINSDADTLSIRFRSEENSVSDITLEGSQIVGISVGDYESNGGFLGLLLGTPPQDRTRYLVEYMDEQDSLQTTRIELKREFSRYFESDLDNLSRHHSSN
jgi:hypothetical protein